MIEAVSFVDRVYAITLRAYDSTVLNVRGNAFSVAVMSIAAGPA